MLRVYEEEVAGQEYVTKEGNILSLSFKGEVGHLGVTEFTATCDICSKDEIMFPEGSIKVTIRHFRNKTSPCGCSKSYSYNENQRSIQVVRQLEGTGWKFQGFPEGLRGTVNTKVQLLNPITLEIWEPLLANVLKTKPKFCKGTLEDYKNIQIVFEDYISNYPKGSVISRNLYSPEGKNYLISCPVCKDAGNPIRSSDIKRGRRPCKCGYKHQGYYPNRLMEDDTLYLVKVSCESGGLRKGW